MFAKDGDLKFRGLSEKRLCETGDKHSCRGEGNENTEKETEGLMQRSYWKLAAAQSVSRVPGA